MANSQLRLTSIICSGGFGGLLAILADVLQKQQASTVAKMDDALKTTLGLPVPILVVIPVLMALGVGLCLVFKVESREAAFFRGASVIALLMTVVPYNVPPELPRNQDQANTLSQQLDLGNVVFAQTRGNDAQSKVNVQLVMPNGGQPSSAIYTLKDASNGAVIARSNVQGSAFDFYVPNRTYLLQVEVANCRIEQRQLSVNGPQSLTIHLVNSSVPAAIQRLWTK
jgi:hypothetical protein